MACPQTPQVLIKVEPNQAEDQFNLNTLPYLCPFCGKTFVTEINLGTHLSEHVLRIDSVFKSEEQSTSTMACPQTPHVLIKVEPNQAEDQFNLNTLPYFCPFCGKTFVTEINLGTHLSEHVLRIDSNFKSEEQYTPDTQPINHVKCEYKSHKKKLYFCPVCDKEFYPKIKLTRHLKEVHSDYRPYQCSKCPKSFKKSSHFTQHLYLHEDKKRFVCDICGTGFNHKISLINHLRIHSLLPLLHCKICNRYYKSSQSYSVHLKDVHSEAQEENKWKCKECDCAYSIKSSLKTHIRRSHRKTLVMKTPQPWACSECPRSYSTKKILNEHKRRKHKSEIKCEVEV